MVLVDTSVWVAHLRLGNSGLACLLNHGGVLLHPFIIGEIALGNLARRDAILAYLSDQPNAAVATPREVLRLIEQNGLAGSGIGYIDAHLLAAARLSPGTAIWTYDKRLHAAAARLRMAYRA